LIRNNAIKITIFYLISISFILLNMWFVIKKDFLIINLLPLILGIALFVIFSFDKILYFIIFFTPLSLSLSDLVYGLSFDMFLPTEPLLFLVLILFIFKLVHERNYDREILIHPVSIALYLYLTWMLITCFTSTMIVTSLKFWLSRVWFIVVLYMVTTKIFSDREKMKNYIWLYVIPFILVIFYSTYRHIGYGLWNKQAAHSVVSPFYNDHTSYGAALAIYLPFLALFAFGQLYSKKMKIFSLVVFLIFLSGLVLSYSRAAWISVIVGIAFWIIIKFKIKLRMIFTAIILFLMLVFTFQNSVVMYLERNSGESSSNLVEHFSSISNITSDASNLERINRWSCAIRMFADKPLFGWGPGTYMFKYAPYQLNKDRTIISTNYGDLGNAHSEYLGALSESGILGLLTFLLALILVVRTGINTYRRMDDKTAKSIILAALTGLITYYTHAFLNNFLDTDKLSVPFWGFTGIIVAMDICSRKRENQTKKEIST